MIYNVISGRDEPQVIHNGGNKMSRERKLLLGATTDNTLVFANVRVGGNDWVRDHFTVSFDVVRPIEVTDELLKERASDIIFDLDDDDILEMLRDYDCKPSKLVDEYLSDMLHQYGVEGIIDISLYPESFLVHGYDEIYFEAERCGQCNVRNILLPIDEIFSDWLHKMWDEYHLKTLNEDLRFIANSMLDDYEKRVGDEREWIQNWLNNLYWGE